MGNTDFPLIQSAIDGWKVETKAGAGGYAYLFPENERKRLADTNLLWSWSVKEFPQTKAVTPLDKGADDYALRVGLLVRGNGEVQMPPALKEAARKCGIVSYVLFYSATDKRDLANQCFKNPFNDRVVDCLEFASEQRSEVKSSPLLDLSGVLTLSKDDLSKLEVVGVWIFADSDNSKSTSKAHLYQLRLGSAGGG